MFGGAVHLALHPQEILLAEDAMFSRTYRRFALRDLRSVMLVRSLRPTMVVATTWIPSLAICLLALNFASEAGMISLVVTSPLWVFGLVYWFMGPRSNVFVDTGVHVIQIGAAVRRGRAQRGVLEIQAATEAAQQAPRAPDAPPGSVEMPGAAPEPAPQIAREPGGPEL